MQIHNQVLGTIGLIAAVLIFFIAFFLASFFVFESIINLLIEKNISVQDYLYR